MREMNFPYRRIPIMCLLQVLPSTEGEVTHRKKGEYRQKLREDHLEGFHFKRLQHNLCLFFPWEPCAYTLAVQSR